MALVDAVDGSPKTVGKREQPEAPWQMPEGCPALGSVDGDFIAVRNGLLRSDGAPDYNTSFHALLRLTFTGQELEAVRARAKNRAQLLRRYLDVDPDPVSGEGLLAVGEWISEGSGPDSPGPADGPGGRSWCPEGHRWNTADGELPADERVAVCMRCPATAIRVQETTLQDEVEESSPALAACRPAGVSHERTRQALTGAYLVLDETEGEERARWERVLKGLETALAEDQGVTLIPFTSEAFEQWRTHLAEMGYSLELYVRPSADEAASTPDAIEESRRRGARRRESWQALVFQEGAESMRACVKAELLRIRAPWDALQVVDSVLVEAKGGTRG